MLELPMTAGIVGALIAPALVAIGAIAALARNFTLVVERTDDDVAGEDVDVGTADIESPDEKSGISG